NKVDNLNFENAFHIINKLGDGGWGELYKVQDKSNNKYYALKKLTLNDKEKQYVLNETQNLIKPGSKFVIQYYHSWVESNFLYHQMELCLDNLTNVLKIKDSLFSEIMNILEFHISYYIFYKLVKCVQYLHESDIPITHRDLKLENVFISMDGRIILSGLFLAKEVVNDLMYSDVGDLRYQAPEVGTDTNGYNHLIDIYSLSMIGAQIFGFDIYDIFDGK
ncbi:unnamed protein product, partial [Oppiella nova]